jgi:dTDP-4-amino-4,6-dideoxygalactose transaminase
MTPQTLHEALQRLGERRLRAVLPVHLRGDAVDLPALAALTQEAGGVLVEDAAHALGTTMDYGLGAERVGDGRHSAMTTFSFHPVKTIATGEGGMVTTGDANLAERLRVFRSHGMVRPEHGPAWWYEMPEIGFNYRLPDVLCALGLSQLAKLDRFAAARRTLAAVYGDALAALAPEVQIAASPAWSRPVPHLMTVLIDFESAGRDRGQVMAALQARGVGSQVHYIPVHRQPYYAERYGSVVLPGAEAWYARCLSLPLYPAMTEADVNRVAGALGEALGR